VPPETPAPTKTGRAGRFEAAINEIEALVSDKYPISRGVLDIIRRAKSSD
jgi:hypothetical protein